MSEDMGDGFKDFDLELVKGNDPHLVLVDEEERLPLVFTREEVVALRDWCDYALCVLVGKDGRQP